MAWWSSASASSTFNSSFLLRSSLSSYSNKKLSSNHVAHAPPSLFSPYITINSFKKRCIIVTNCTTTNKKNMESSSTVDCVETGTDVECLISPTDKEEIEQEQVEQDGQVMELGMLLEWAVLVSPFFFWGTAMVAMKEVLPKAGTFFVAAFRLIPAGLLLITFASSQGRKLPSGFNAWVSIFLFALVDASCFQGFLAQGLQRTSAGLGSVIIDSQPLSVAVLAALLFGESIGLVGAGGLVLGVIGLLLLEAPAFDESNSSLWGSGEWWMLLAAQSMAVGTVMVRWVSKYSDPVMATGWHMVIGGLPLVVISVLNHDPVYSESVKELTSSDILALLYTSIFGSAISYGVYFYSATKGFSISVRHSHLCNWWGLLLLWLLYTWSTFGAVFSEAYGLCVNMEANM
ncbi:WAT1-related protein At3g02690, chloroplastic isoform X2 [Citrus sinensis]|uniref:WAT1-related protein At3g02690, chloroplastic isoform X2 n=1 Tax=Citrus clementina TaxID=85681 RepID=UPI000CECF79E|nr:WAT1-related protein At3g02690, chloroplastic isoform X2 [Citrus x clementina]XP_024955590.1 WAT1-related protein At3g02690, chloroplastic isoform X2 [Citrus sinensis]